MQDVNAHSPQVETQTASTSVWQRLTGIFFTPSAVFAALRCQPDFLAPMLVMALLTAGFSVFFTVWVKVDPKEVARRAVERQLESQGKRWNDLSDAEQQQFEQGIELSASLQRFAPIIGAGVGILATLALAGLYYLGMLLLCGQTSFQQVLSVTAYATYATDGIKYLLNFLVVFLRPPDVEQVIRARGSFVVSNPAPLLPESTPAWALAMLNWLDVFSLWFIALMAIGLAAIAYKKTPQQMAIIPGSLWLLGLLGSVVFAVVTGGR
ncbi:MAG: YIP1 family protein [Acidobacteriota bacterium]